MSTEEEAAPLRLSDELLIAPSRPGLLVPAYDRAVVRPGVLHFGFGNFHRAHQAVYLDSLLAAGDPRWGVVGVGARPSARLTRAISSSQDHLYTVIEKAPTGAWVSRVVGSVRDVLDGLADPGAVIEAVADPATKLITITVTEGGYPVRRDGAFDDGAPFIQHDLVSSGGGDSWVGLLVRGLERRFRNRAGGLTITSCDNIQANGRVTETAVVGMARTIAPQVVPWLLDNVRFPSSMVDRLAPATEPSDSDYLAAHYGYLDRTPVTTEPFSQWVVEDCFGAGGPDLESVGVSVVSDVLPYEVMKLRLANGTHQALCYFGALLGLTYVHEAVADPDIHALLLRYLDDEAVPSLVPIAGVDFDGWGRTVLERFGSDQITDRTSRICEHSSDRIPGFLLPVVRDRLRDGGSISACAAVLASWARFSEGTDESGQPIRVVDALHERLKARTVMAGASPEDFLDDEVFGDLGHDETLRQAFTSSLDLLHRRGARALLRQVAGAE